ncbi:GlxA family transcriptional regulator [Caballeronia sp. Sq4a]|uniref:GlxA family transcriptional regulator n=1 Tax=Caballeronia sp. Sq4a TaxID=2878152 RepID=UPI0020BDE775|nr:DJ-1/PfpI family protein [Caballeronia sp. Sq4a]
MAKTIAILAVPGVQMLDVCGPLDVFAQANVETGRDEYELKIVGTRRGQLRSSSGARLLPDEVVGDDFVAVHTLLVAGAPHASTMTISTTLREWLRTVAKRSKRFGSVCTGAFILAEAGLLERKRVTTHWSCIDELSRRYPTVTAEPDALYVRDGKLRTAAGVTAGLDLSLALVEEDLGREIAMRVASQLVMFFKRPGGQLQFSRKGRAQPAGRSVLQEVQRLVAARPELDHSVASMAAHARLSPRHFARLFQAEVGVTPAVWVESARVAAARNLIETRGDAPKQLAAKCGFANADVLRRTFVKHVGVTPSEYRKRFMTLARADEGADASSARSRTRPGP